MKFRQLKVLILLILVVLVTSRVPIFEFKPFQTEMSYKEFPKSSGSWVLSPIYIDGEASGVGAHNWTWAKNQPWCSGDGSFINPYVLENITINAGGSGFCVSVENSGVFFEIRNSEFSNAGFTFPDSAILLNNVGNATIMRNNLTDTNFIGIRMDNSDNNYLIGNNASLTDLGILMTNSEFNHITENTVNDNIENAINIDDFSNNNTISGNTIISANSYGISIFSYSNNNTVSGNYVEGNFIGISMLDHCDYNRVYGNKLVDNDFGVSIHNFNSTQNVVYNNTFLLNTVNGEDDSFNINYWSYGMLGNYWDDYGGDDSDDDGIGDTPYVVSGIRGRLDYYPIWDDGDDIYPTMTRNSPAPPFTFGATAPTFNLTIYDVNLHMAWYKLNNTYTHFFTPVNGINIVQIDQSSWDSLAEGSFSLGFFVNDTSGNLLTIGMTVTKELPPEEPPPTPEIPFGHSYLVFLGIGVLILIAFHLKKRK